MFYILAEFNESRFPYLPKASAIPSSPAEAPAEPDRRKAKRDVCSGSADRADALSKRQAFAGARRVRTGKSSRLVSLTVCCTYLLILMKVYLHYLLEASPIPRRGAGRARQDALLKGRQSRRCAPAHAPGTDAPGQRRPAVSRIGMTEAAGVRETARDEPDVAVGTGALPTGASSLRLFRPSAAPRSRRMRQTASRSFSGEGFCKDDVQHCACPRNAVPPVLAKC